MITMAAMSQMCAMCTMASDRCMIVVGNDRNDLLLMIAAVLDSLRLVMCTAMVPGNAATGRPRRRTAA
jgi:hypothetical protein